jgi:cell division protein FtsI (penicillin-binding protein 3)
MTTRSTRSPRRRTVVALAIVLAVLAAFVVRLVDIQVVNARTNVDNALQYGLGVTQTLAGTRGTIVDAEGQALASSVLVYNCQLDPTNISAIGSKNSPDKAPWSEVSDKIATIVGQSGDDVRKLVSDALAANKASQYAKLQNGLSTEQYRKLMELGTSYIACTPQPSRTYPNGAVGGNLIGFLNGAGQAQSGIESMENSCLSPKSGTLSFQKGNDGVIIPGTETEKPAVNGGTVKLTIDSDLQWYLQQLIAQGTQDMGAQYGTITVVDVKTGQIKAAAEYPTLDPNNLNAPGNYKYSRIFNSQFEPGSTFKGLLASMLIDGAGQSPTSTAMVSTPERFPNGAVVHDSFSHPTYDYTLTGVLIDSSNAGASVFSQRIAPQLRYDYLKKFGIGDGSAVHFSAETQGLLYPVKDWNNQQLYDTSYGQGLTTTVPELIEAYDAIANNGVRVPLSLVQSCTKADGTVVKPTQPKPVQVISPSASSQVRDILENVAMQASYSDLIKIPGYRLATKTGTGQIADGHGGYKSDVYYTTMIGFAPADDPQYLVAVTLDEPTAVRSSTANAPIWQKAMTQVLKTFRVMPSTTSPTVLPKFG